MEKMSKDTFEIFVTQEGKNCVKKKMDELTKNHRHFDESNIYPDSCWEQFIIPRLGLTIFSDDAHV
jgi:hypothetical protein